MPSRQQLESALINADAAGDVEAATQLATALKNGAFDDAAQLNSEQKINSDMNQVMARPSPAGELGDTALSFVGGANTTIPNILGMPMDFATNIRNLIAATEGTAGDFVQKQLGMQPTASLAPSNQPIDPGSQVLSSNWFREKIKGLIGGDPFSPVDPTSSAQRMANVAGAVTGASLLTPGRADATSAIRQMAGNAGQMIPAAIPAAIASEVYPNSPVAPAVAALAGSAAYAGVKSLPKTKPAEAFLKAKEAGYVVPPSMAKRSMAQQVAEGAAGPVPLKQLASIKNQQITNNLAKRALGLSDDIQLTPEILDGVRAQAGTVYNEAKNLGTFTTDKAYKAQLKNIANVGGALSREFPGLVKKDVVSFIKQFDKNTISAESTIEAIKQLRADSKAGWTSPDPQIKAMAKAQGKVAEALEGVIERNIEGFGSSFLGQFRDARATIAKTYEIENALNPANGNVNAIKIGQSLKKGKPLMGELKQIGEFANSFKHIAQESPPQVTNIRPMDYLLGGGVAAATSNPALIALTGARPVGRAALLSKQYQNVLAKIPQAQYDAIMKMPKEAQLVVLSNLLANSQQSKDSTKPK